MSEAKFTPGPWKATYDSQLQALIQIYSTEAHLPVAVLPDRGTIEAMSEIEANANLIVAAPDMYEALEEVCHDCDDTGTIDDECKSCSIYKALRKARGEDNINTNSEEMN